MYEDILCRAMDFIADDNERAGNELIQECISKAKVEIQKNTNAAEAYYYWGMSLNILGEYQQAVLKFEKSLEYKPNYEESLRQIVDILFTNLGKAQSAKIILEERLLKMFPEKQEYIDMLEDVKTYLDHAYDPGG